MVLLAVALVPLAIAAGHNLLTPVENIAITMPFAAVGVLVARRQPDNVIGWLMIVPALAYLLGTDAGLYALYRTADRLESARDTPRTSVLARVGDLISGIPH